MARLLNRISYTVICALLLAGVVAGQDDVSETGGLKDESGTPKTKGEPGKPQYLFRTNRVVEITTNPDLTQTERVIPSAELKDLQTRNLIPRIHASNLFKVTASIRPRQLAPGETGTLHVLVMLSADTVVLPGAKILLKVFSETLPVTVGNSDVVPARKGTLRGRFHDVPVYDNVVEIRTPVTINPETKADRYPIAGHVEIELHSNTTGQRIGEFYSGIDGWLKVGRSLGSAATPVQPRATMSNPKDEGVGKAPATNAGPRTPGSSVDGARDSKSGVSPSGPPLDAPTPDARSKTPPNHVADGGSALTSSSWSAVGLGIAGLVLLGLLVIVLGLGRQRA